MTCPHCAPVNAEGQTDYVASWWFVSRNWGGARGRRCKGHKSEAEHINEYRNPGVRSCMHVSPIQLNPSMPGSSTIHTITTVRLPIPAFARMRERAQLLSTGPEARYTHRVFVCLPPLLSFQVANSGPVCKAKLLARRERGGDGWWMFARAATWRRLHNCAPPSQHIGPLKLPLQSFVNCSLTSKPCRRC